MRRSLKTLATAVVLAFAPAAFAQAGSPIDAQVKAFDKTANNRGQAHVASKISSNFTSLAGSEENALALVNALRTGEAVRLTYPPTGTGATPTISTIDPPTGNMGWGNVKISLALAQDQLARLGVTHPTAEQLQAALNGGSVAVKNPDGTTTTTPLRGVLQMRVDGMGWGEIAKAGGTKVGPVVSQLKMAHAKVATIPTGATTTTAAPATPKATTAAGASGKSHGITTAAGGSDVAGKHHGAKGITTADGAAGVQRGNAYGKGVVTASGGSAGSSTSLHGKATTGAGVVSGTGGNVAGITTAHGNAGGNGKGNAGGNGKGKGG